MEAALYNIGDKVTRIDCDDPKKYTIDKIREHKGYWIYSMGSTGTVKEGWAGIAVVWWGCVEVVIWK